MSTDDNAGEKPTKQMIHVVNLGAFNDMPTLFRQLGTDLFRRGSGVQFHDFRDRPPGQPEILDEWLQRFANFETFVEQLEGRLKRHSNGSGSAASGTIHSVILCLAPGDVPPVKAPLDAPTKPKAKFNRNAWPYPQPEKDVAPEPEPEPTDAYPVADKVKAALSRINVQQSVGVSTVVLVPMSSQGADDQKRLMMLRQLDALLKVPPDERQHHGRIGIVGATGENGPRDAFICLRALILAMQTENQWTQLRDPNAVRTHVMTLDRVPEVTSAEVIARALATSLSPGPAGDAPSTAADGSALTLKTFLKLDPGTISSDIEAVVPPAYDDAQSVPRVGMYNAPEIAEKIGRTSEAAFLREIASVDIVNLPVNWRTVDDRISSLTPAPIPKSFESAWNRQSKDLAKKIVERRRLIDEQRGAIEGSRSAAHLVDATTGLPAVDTLQGFRAAWETYRKWNERVTTATQVILIGMTLFVTGGLALLLGLLIDNNVSLFPLSENSNRAYFDKIAGNYLVAFFLALVLGSFWAVFLLFTRRAAGKRLAKAADDFAMSIHTVRLAEARALNHAQALKRYARLLSRLSACAIESGDRTHHQSFQVNLPLSPDATEFAELDRSVRESYGSRTESDVQQRILALLRDQSFGEKLPKGRVVFDGRDNDAVVQRLFAGDLALRFESRGDQSR
jgi:hypothetical protein